MTALEEIIRSEIEAAGAISFARFMELALYHPDHGYYERHVRQTGRKGDFYTNVSVGSLYGELLGLEFADRICSLLEADARQRVPTAVQLVEGGAHDGQLARDILGYLREYQKAAFRRLEYIIIEPSAARAQQQFQALADYDGKVRWVRDWEQIGEFRGICFSNELFDAMPVHVFRWDGAGKTWNEWGIANANGNFDWRPLSPEKHNANAVRLLARLPPDLLAVLPEDFTVEISPEAVSWWMRAAHALVEGWLFTVDYGLLQEDFFQPQRSRGTLRAYSKHLASGNLLEAVGEQDITAHVNFSLMIAAAESAGLKTEAFIHQGVFIKGVLEKVERAPAAFPLWTPMRYRQLTSLLHPEHLGRAFKVLIQSRSV